MNSKGMASLCRDALEAKENSDSPFLTKLALEGMSASIDLAAETLDSTYFLNLETSFHTLLQELKEKDRDTLKALLSKITKYLEKPIASFYKNG